MKLPSRQGSPTAAHAEVLTSRKVGSKLACEPPETSPISMQRKENVKFTPQATTRGSAIYNTY